MKRNQVSPPPVSSYSRVAIAERSLFRAQLPPQSRACCSLPASTALPPEPAPRLVDRGAVVEFDPSILLIGVPTRGGNGVTTQPAEVLRRFQKAQGAQCLIGFGVISTAGCIQHALE